MAAEGGQREEGRRCHCEREELRKKRMDDDDGIDIQMEKDIGICDVRKFFKYLNSLPLSPTESCNVPPYLLSTFWVPLCHLQGPECGRHIGKPHV